MSTVTSSDGTTIAYSKTGSGPALILVDGAMCYRDFGPAKKFTEALADSFTVYTYDRRGRGESSNTEPFDVQREVEDLAAVVKEAGGSPYVFGHSSGAALALEAANAGEPISKLAVYEAPFIVDPSGPVGKDEQYWPAITGAIAEGRNGDAVKHFMRLVGVPGLMVTLFPVMPAWKKLKAIAPTLPYDQAVLASNRTGRPLPEDRYEGVRMPVLSMAGGKSDEWFRNAMRNVAERVADGRYRTIDGQNHMLKAAAIAPALKEFFGS
jgi:pimeloyl-ACP methyl ester carboxylesterase